MKISSKQNPSIKYFNKRTIKALYDPVEKLAHDYYYLFKKEVNLMLRWHPDMPVTLTGGTDTRMILGVMSKKERQSRRFITYRTDLVKDEDNDDIVISKMIAEKFNLNHDVLNNLAYNPHKISDDYFDELSRSDYNIISGFFGSELLRFTPSYPNNISEITRKYLKSPYSEYEHIPDPFINPDNRETGKKPIPFALKSLKPYFNKSFHNNINLSGKDIRDNIKHIKSPYPESTYLFETLGPTFFKRENGGAVSGQLMLTDICKALLKPFAIPELAFLIFGINPRLLQNSKDDITNHILKYLPKELLDIPSNSSIANYQGTVLHKMDTFKSINTVKTTTYNSDFLLKNFGLLADTGFFNPDKIIKDIGQNEESYTHWWGNNNLHVWGDLIYWLKYIYDI